MAPEIFDNKYNEKIDIWSAGVIMYIMLSGSFPFKGDNASQISEAIKLRKIDTTSGIWKKISPEAQDLLHKMLTIDPNSRISASEALNHNWISSQVKQTYDENLYEKLKSIKVKPTQAINTIETLILMYISTHTLSNQEESKLAMVFKSLDVNSDGKISKEELWKGCNLIDLDISETNKIFDMIDVDKSGFIDYSEYLVACMV
jgi:calcium-dependent protein kinase